MLDHQHDVLLYGVSGRGFELAERYRDLAELESLPAGMHSVLTEIADEREALMDRFRDTIQQEGGLAKAGNPDREFLESLIDRWAGSLAGLERIVERLVRADQEWQQELEEAERDQWPAAVLAIMDELLAHLEQSRERLQQLDLSSDN
ncbi:hypothetical protein [Motiliproteus sediminis]|uniref:hypothetical protein n=1 Tax=Motiliproteus sediminis TaxID=1468178 RepID=UPI001AF006C0|nr:hypothetical protein [Motiliproteus sediminis]